MKPISPVLRGLEQHEVKCAEHQDEYETLPLLPIDGGQRVLSRWHLSWRERLVVLFNGSIYLHIFTFNNPVQPVLLEVDEPKLNVENRMDADLDSGRTV